jgi:hypothetical protein
MGGGNIGESEPAPLPGPRYPAPWGGGARSSVRSAVPSRPSRWLARARPRQGQLGPACPPAGQSMDADPSVSADLVPVGFRRFCPRRFPPILSPSLGTRRAPARRPPCRATRVGPPPCGRAGPFNSGKNRRQGPGTVSRIRFGPNRTARRSAQQRRGKSCCQTTSNVLFAQHYSPQHSSPSRCNCFLCPFFFISVSPLPAPCLP